MILIMPALGVSKPLSLEAAIKMAQEHSFTIKSARYDSSSARYSYQSAKSSRFPSLSLSATSYRVDKLQKVEVIPGGIEIGSKDNYQADFKLILPLFTGGRISNQIKSRKAAWQGQSYNLSAARLAGAYQCRLAWLSANMRAALVRSAERSLKRLEIIREDVNNLHINGLADSVDILDAELACQKANEMLLEARTNHRHALIRLAELTGIGDETSLVLEDNIAEPDTLRIELSGLSPEDIARPELKVAGAQIQTARHAVGLNKAAYFPSINAFGGYSIGKPNRNYFEADWNDYFSAGLTLNWEFNLGGRSVHDVRSARHIFYSAQMNQKALEEMLMTQAKTAAEDFRLAYSEFEIAKKEYEITGQKFRLGREKQRAGTMSVNRLLELEAEHAAAEQMYHASRINFYLMESGYLYAIGSTGIYGGL